MAQPPTSLPCSSRIGYRTMRSGPQQSRGTRQCVLRSPCGRYRSSVVARSRVDGTFTPLEEILTKVDSARAGFAAGSTRASAWRVATLKRVRDLLVEREPRLIDAPAAELGKARFEAWTTEVGFAIAEIT